MSARITRDNGIPKPQPQKGEIGQTDSESKLQSLPKIGAEEMLGYRYDVNFHAHPKDYVKGRKSGLPRRLVKNLKGSLPG